MKAQNIIGERVKRSFHALSRNFSVMTSYKMLYVQMEILSPLVQRVNHLTDRMVSFDSEAAYLDKKYRMN